MIEDAYVAHSLDREILDRAHCGGVVSSLLKFALESGEVQAVVAIRARNGNRYDGVPVTITNPDEIADTAGTLHCSSVNIARYIKEYLNGASDMKIAVVCKPCDARAIIELAKREQIKRENLFMVGLNCTGTLAPVVAKKMLEEEFKVSPADVAMLDIEDDKLIVTLKDNARIERELTELEDKGYGRRENCRRCEINIPIMADIACGKWGIDAGEKATFVQLCSKKGSDLFKAAVKSGCIEAKQADQKTIDIVETKDKAARELALQWQESDLAPFDQMSQKERFDYWSKEFERCIKCFGCRDACPICYCTKCYLDPDRGLVAAGEIPPEPLFPMIRAAHVMDSCVNCGQCQDACTMELPVSRLVFFLSKKISEIFKHEPGMDVLDTPPLKVVTDEEISIEPAELVEAVNSGQ